MSKRSKTKRRATAPPRNIPPIESESRRERGLAACVLLVAAVAFLVYLNTLHNAFVADDWVFIATNPALGKPISLSKIFGSSFWEAMGRKSSSTYYRPIIALLTMIEYRLFGHAPAGYHVVNNLFHAAVSVGVFFLALRWLKNRFAALATALLFAVHPIHTQSVTMISGITDVLATFFVLGGLLVLPATVGEPEEEPRARTFLRQGIAALAFLLALLSKEVAIVFPALVFLGWWLQRGSFWKSLFPPGRYRYFFLILILPLAIWLALRMSAVSGATFATKLVYHYGPWTRVLTIAKVYGFYLVKLLIPWPLSYESGVFAASGPGDPLGYFWLAVIGGLLFLAWKLRASGPVVSFATLFLLVAILPSSNIVPLTDLAKEHFAYLPSVGFCLLPGALLLLAPMGRKHARRRGYWAVAAGAVLVLFGGLTLRQNRVWKDRETFWRHVVDTLPPLPQATVDDPHYSETVSAYPFAYLALGNVLAERGDWAGAEKTYHEGLRCGPDSPDLNNMLGTALMRRGAEKEALACFRRALANRKNFLPAAIGVAEIDLNQGRPAEAVAVLKTQDPTGQSITAPYWYFLAQSYAQTGAVGKAVEAFQTLEKDPGLTPPMRLNAAAFYYQQRRPADAVRWLEPVRANPPEPMYLAALAQYLIAGGRRAEARAVTAQLRAMEPRDPRLPELERSLNAPPSTGRPSAPR